MQLHVCPMQVMEIFCPYYTSQLQVERYLKIKKKKKTHKMARKFQWRGMAGNF
jgi:hypothetical protein